MAFDILIEKILAKNNPTVVGIDPRPEYIPPMILEKHFNERGETADALAEAYYEFGCGLIDALQDIIPAVKPQSAYFEMLGPEGVSVFKRLAAYAKQCELYTIADAKRGDIGSTAEAYAEAYLGSVKAGSFEFKPFGFDCLTVNTYLGTDGVKPFLDVCKREDKAIFALVKTSNKSSGELQDLTSGGQMIYEHVASLMEDLSADSTGAYAFGTVGMVVGATYPGELSKLRQRFKNTFFLIPGYGKQGGSAKDASAGFDGRGLGAIVNSSRAIMCAWQKTGRNGTDYKDASRTEALNMKNDLRIFIRNT